MVALGIATGLEAFGLTPRLKWPNDVWLDGRKVAGVLLEMTTEADRVEWVVAGFGLNVVRTADSPAAAAYVSDARDDLGVAEVTASVLDGVAGCIPALARRGVRPHGRAVRSALGARGASPSWSATAPGSCERGVRSSASIARGGFVLRGDAGVVRVASGEVTLRR